MRTTKPISTISFNSPAFLKLKLEELTKAGKISFWAFIPHKPEDDEAGTKDHNHLYVEPSKMMQTDDLKAELMEYDPEHPTKPKGCLPFRTSKFSDWYLYSLHDKRYLASKGQSRRFHYKHEEMISGDPDNLLALARSIDLLSLSPYADMQDAIKNGVTWNEYFARGYVPLPQIKGFMLAWESLGGSGTNRAGRPGHLNRNDQGDFVNTSTGEILPEEKVYRAERREAVKKKKKLTETSSEWMPIPEEDPFGIE